MPLPSRPSPAPWSEHPSRPGQLRTLILTVTLADGVTTTCPVSLWHYPPVRRRRGPRRRLLLIHGFRGDHHGMQLVVDALPEQELLVPDLPGFGASPPLPSGVHDADTYARVVEALARSLDLDDQDVLLGHSFGSIVAAAHTAWQQSLPEGRRWAGLGLLNPISDGIFTGRLLPGAAAVEAYYRVCGRLPEPWALALLRSPLILGVTNLTMIVSRDRDVVRYVRDQHQQHFGGFADRETVLQAYRSSSRTTVTSFAERLDLPALLVVGARDQLSTLRGRQRLAGRLPQCRMEVIRGVGHLLHYEKPAETARAIRRFLRGL
ncbi:alpha/beta hydrolase [Nesterenkonia sp. HG001]|uniref:alpha/beta fold hydrolase n=1 Tax=Nesterenkonia sp. HG001 TaxID=2983207 RepID=UPI002AC7AB1C|nr:alpha/beta hydrolase [Nesterenkonia sp. HG001]MDZ5077913.1 alpha/beta hydrolase [Nesterenkonia sp. HG001]